MRQELFVCVQCSARQFIPALYGWQAHYGLAAKRST
jgi:hypothetical protein